MTIKQFVCTNIACIIMALLSLPVQSSPVAYGISTTIVSDNIFGSYQSSINDGDALSGTFITDNDIANASNIDSSNPNATVYDFIGPPYGALMNVGSYSFNSDAASQIEVGNDIDISSADTNGLIADGVYDLVAIFGVTTGVGSTSGEEWGINFIAGADWFTDTSTIPGLPPALSYNILLQADEYDSSGTSVGTLLALVNLDSVSAVPIPAAVWLFSAGLIGLIGVARRKKQ